MKSTSDPAAEWVASLQAWILDLVRTEVQKAVATATRPVEIFTSREAAEFARVSMATVRRWVRDGRIVPYGVGRRARFKREDIERVLSEGARHRVMEASWRRKQVPETPIPLEMNAESAALLLKEIRALLRGWHVPDHITPKMLAGHMLERDRLCRILRENPTAMSQDDLRLLSAEMNWLRWATQTTK